ncbi:hypothetical protein CLV46_1101 [Diaminobutyricimonas aerilata]|uniref:Uncharacterized protein n=1 Tax=Diaminobutyricimonas aerilata TaxID=1162967 RepID=A0A2M9CI52_9MICO|nr:hypothetical protein [Diaminobutyricimonas aerilata]PJJ71552.1 hypothetical protein CLV46_1101 [Diaminobutyricimonas aerilata]
MLPFFPIPVQGDVPPWVLVLFGIAAITGFVVLVYQAVRWFRDNRDDDDRGGDDRSGEPGER